MKYIGLTGGIASGKSTVSAMLREKGAQIIDADQVAREVVEPGQPALAEIAARFPGVLGPDGRLDRARLGERIFGNDAERAALNAIIHPRIQQSFMDQTRELERRGFDLVIYDAPLLIENRIHEWMNGVILVTAPREVQLQRLMARNALTREQAEARLASQMPLEDKQQYATWIIDNAGDLAATRAQVDRVYKALETLR